MDILEEDAEYVTVQLDHVELVGLHNSVAVALTFHKSELHTLTALTEGEARRIIATTGPVIDRMREARERAGLNW